MHTGGGGGTPYWVLLTNVPVRRVFIMRRTWDKRGPPYQRVVSFLYILRRRQLKHVMHPGCLKKLMNTYCRRTELIVARDFDK